MMASLTGGRGSLWAWCCVGGCLERDEGRLLPCVGGWLGRGGGGAGRGVEVSSRAGLGRACVMEMMYMVKWAARALRMTMVGV